MGRAIEESGRGAGGAPSPRYLWDIVVIVFHSPRLGLYLFRDDFHAS